MNYLASHPAFNDTIDSLKNEFMTKRRKHFYSTNCANPEVNGNTSDAAFKTSADAMYKPSLWTRFIWWLKDKFCIV